MRPRIGISLKFADPLADPKEWRGHYRHYFEVIRAAGGEPIPLAPDNIDPAQFGRATAEGSPLRSIDGLLLAGGGDIDPARYGEAPDGTDLQGVDPRRDELELTLVRRAVARDLPVFGICRGIQTLNVALGGRLVQHVPGHRIGSAGGWIQHWVEIVPDSRLASILGADRRIVVNSHHHQAVTQDRLAPPLVVSAFNAPGSDLVEAVEHPGRRWVMAVQWHPERLWEVPDAHYRLFEAFIQAATK
jgi:putative glutamine amidotransferase